MEQENPVEKKLAMKVGGTLVFGLSTASVLNYLAIYDNRQLPEELLIDPNNPTSIVEYATRFGLNTDILSIDSPNIELIPMTGNDEMGGEVISTDNGIQLLVSLQNIANKKYLKAVTFTHEYCHLSSLLISSPEENREFMLRTIQIYQDDTRREIYPEFFNVLDYIFYESESQRVQGGGHSNMAGQISGGIEEIKDMLESGQTSIAVPYNDYINIDLIEEFYATLSSLSAINLDPDQIPVEILESIEGCVDISGFNSDIYDVSPNYWQYSAYFSIILSIIIASIHLRKHFKKTAREATQIFYQNPKQQN